MGPILRPILTHEIDNLSLPLNIARFRILAWERTIFSSFDGQICYRFVAYKRTSIL